MKIVEVKDRDPQLMEQLLEVWENSVRATHLFLSGEDVEDLKRYVPQALKEIPCLIIAGQHLEMLFIAREERGKGWGKKLLQYGMEKYRVDDLAVNEQNPLAKGFYEHMGFKVYKRTEQDEQGNPYPLLYMRRQ